MTSSAICSGRAGLRDATCSVRQLLLTRPASRTTSRLLGSDDGPQVKDRDVLTLLHRANKLYFPPGTSWRYSNSGYALLALIVERVSGESFARIPAPPDLRPRRNARRGRARGRRRHGRASRVRLLALTTAPGVAPTRAARVPCSATAASTRRLRSSRTGAPRSTHNAVLTPRVVRGGDDARHAVVRRRTSYGFGWFLDSSSGSRRQRHEGDSIGFRTAIQRYPDGPPDGGRARQPRRRADRRAVRRRRAHLSSIDDASRRHPHRAGDGTRHARRSSRSSRGSPSTSGSRTRSKRRRTTFASRCSATGRRRRSCSRTSGPRSPASRCSSTTTRRSSAAADSISRTCSCFPRIASRGVGRRLLSHLARIAIERNCGRMEWWVLDWNESGDPILQEHRRACRWTIGPCTGSSGDALDELADL